MYHNYLLVYLIVDIANEISHATLFLLIGLISHV